MDSIDPRNVALVSIRPEFVERILSGEKTVEFRRSTFPETLSAVVVYCTAPVQRVVAFFTVSEIIKAPPKKLWRLFSGTSGIERTAFFKYYEGCGEGRAIRIAEVVPLNRPLPLERIDSGITPPQSVRYLDDRLFERIKQYVA